MNDMQDPDVAAHFARPPALYPPVEPQERGHLDVGDGHRIYWEVCGNPAGIPALFVHGGPGGGCNPDHRRLFDPARYRIVLFDQRGCGRSLPPACLDANTTPHLVADMERLRNMLGVDRWMLLGGSWGSTLALAYALTHRERVAGMILRGVFTARESELRWLYQDGASHLFPEAWDRFIAPIPASERGDLVMAYYRRLIDPDPLVQDEAARAWCAWESGVMTLLPRAIAPADPFNATALRALARIEAHYFIQGAFLEEGQLLRDAPELAGIPGIIVQGRYDAVTPPVTAWQLHCAWPGSQLQIVPDAGHASAEPGILRGLVEATDRMARLLA